MGTDAHTVLAGIELGLYIILLAPTLWNAFTLVRLGQTGWLYLAIFVLVKLTGAAMLININTSTAAASSIGLQVAAQVLYQVALGPLLACTLSFINISAPPPTATATAISNDNSGPYSYRRRRRRSGGSGGILLPLLFSGDLSRRLRLAHLLILTGLILGIVGGVDRAPKSASGVVSPSNLDTGATLLKASAFLFLAALLAMALGLASSWGGRSTLPRSLRTTMAAAALALPLILVRLVYAFLSDFNLDTSTSGGHPDTFNMFAGSWVAYLFLVLFPQVGVVGVFNVAGLAGRQGKLEPDSDSGSGGFGVHEGRHDVVRVKA